MTNTAALNAILISNIPGLGLRVTNGDDGSDLTAQIAHRLALSTEATRGMTVIPGVSAGALAELLADTLACAYSETITGNAATVRPQQPAPERLNGLTRDELATLTELETPATVRNLTRLARLNRLGMVAQQGRNWTLTDMGRTVLNAW